MKNKDLKNFYQKVYKKGESKHYTKLLFSNHKITPEKKAILGQISWRNKKVLDIGCGTGHLAYLMSKKGAKSVLGIDYASEAIRQAESNFQSKNLNFQCLDVRNIKGKFDVITIAGVLEHIDKPLELLKKAKKMLSNKGSIIITCPNWSNVRGYVLLAIKELLDGKITLADIHYFTPDKFADWAGILKMKLTWHTTEQSWGHGEKMIQDFDKRLPKVLPKTKKQKIAKFISWLEKTALSVEDDNKASGAVGVYYFKK